MAWKKASISHDCPASCTDACALRARSAAPAGQEDAGHSTRSQPGKVWQSWSKAVKWTPEPKFEHFRPKASLKQRLRRLEEGFKGSLWGTLRGMKGGLDRGGMKGVFKRVLRR
eukprot:2723371-Amphidinium_carterae.1